MMNFTKSKLYLCCWLFGIITHLHLIKSVFFIILQSENGENGGHEGSKKSKSLNPVLPKRESGTLDPGIREVLEYQKSQLRAGNFVTLS